MTAATSTLTNDAGPRTSQLRGGGGFRLGPFAVDSHGGLRPAPAEGARFRFHWRNRSIEAELHESSFALTALLGRVPSSAAAAAARPGAFAVLSELPAIVPPDWSVRLRPDHRIEIAWAATLARPLDAPGLLSLLTSFLIESAPYLDLLDESGIDPPAGARGSTKV